MNISKQSQIRIINDKLLAGVDRVGIIHFEPQILNFGLEFKNKVRMALKDFSNFNRFDDPHKEHEAGQFIVQGQWLIFRIHYFNLKMNGKSFAPWDARRTRRVLFVRLV